MADITGDGLWFRRYRPTPDAPVRLVCLPHAGGAASFFAPLARACSPRLEVLAVQYPGRQDRRAEPPVTDLRQLADRVCEVLDASDDGRPYALFGHSMGAVLGYEVTRRMEARGCGPVELFASGSRAPSLAPRRERLPVTDEELVDGLRELDGTTAALLDDPEVLRMILPALRADYAAALGYRHRGRPGVACPVTALTGDGDPYVAVPEARAWEGLTPGGFRLRVLPGGHFFLVDRQDEVLRTVEERLVGVPAVS
ncbi:thioesterase II family protein [Streptomyces sp. NPDC012888]|uniref:thioesterase II family protein n=1 Tax=Streptomyces sp. NPDC012888 TaxID=3364855 RepID=UPI0036928D6F